GGILEHGVGLPETTSIPSRRLRNRPERRGGERKAHRRRAVSRLRSRHCPPYPPRFRLVEGILLTGAEGVRGGGCMRMHNVGKGGSEPVRRSPRVGEMGSAVLDIVVAMAILVAIAAVATSGTQVFLTSYYRNGVARQVLFDLRNTQSLAIS